MYVCIYVYPCVYVPKYVCLCMYVCTYICMSACVYVWAAMYMSAYVCIQAEMITRLMDFLSTPFLIDQVILSITGLKWISFYSKTRFKPPRTLGDHFAMHRQFCIEHAPETMTTSVPHQVTGVLPTKCHIWAAFGNRLDHLHCHSCRSKNYLYRPVIIFTF